MIRGLYRGKFLIAIYDENDSLVDVGLSPAELHILGKNRRYRQYIIARCDGQPTTSKNYTIHFIDVTEKHNDIFAEEDENFLNFVEKNRIKTVKEQAEERGVSERTMFRIYRKIKENKGYKHENI